MVLTRGKNQPGPDGVTGRPGTRGRERDDIQDALNTDSPWVDQSQTYTSHASHQVFLREYANNAAGRPVSTGKLLGGKLPEGAPATRTPAWPPGQTTKDQAADLLGLQLVDKDVLNIPMLAVDPYGQVHPRSRARAAAVRDGDRPGRGRHRRAGAGAGRRRALRHAVPHRHRAQRRPVAAGHRPQPGHPAGRPEPDDDDTASADFASQPAGTYDDEMLDAHFIAGDGRVNENIGLTAIHQVFHSEHDRLVDDIKSVLADDTTDQRRRCPRGVEVADRCRRLDTASACSRPPGS